ncbi:MULTISPECIES: ubiquinone anaerobic biosynthesis accessory factor UbiT [Shewanella]|uniref:Ubiquinone biosynthesis accessory factor UbiT n=1 Tax=Shewanella holmiensis TaxID=2952222 RepID=A0A9X2WKH2_9GAMM|nr:SCP2 sterol-binding domain-containing protein [Shewanella sp. ULN5]MCT7940856.1 SCP2 sterol-binding domain-containing protein [Shewanella holmiensis]MDP5146112.1 SCP2 sterol-binding domain-containing protein [Shewanella sp. ULN5]
MSGISQQLASRVLDLAPRVSKKSLALVPDKLKLDLLSKLLNLMLKPQIEQAELDFLKGKWAAISVADIGLQFQLSFDGQLILCHQQQADVTFTANVPELLLVAAGKEDPDTLFFQRKLLIDGDTELGLEVKNLLLGIELDSLPKGAKLAIEKLAVTLQTLQQYQ